MLSEFTLNISLNSTQSVTQKITNYESLNKKYIWIDTPGYGEPDHEKDINNFNSINEHLLTMPYISNVCIMIEMPKRFDYDLFNCIKTYWDLINKNSQIRLLIILTGSNINLHTNLRYDFNNFIFNYKQNNYFKLTNLKYDLMLIPSVQNYNVDLIKQTLINGSITFKLGKLIMTHTNQIISNYNDEMNIILSEINEAKRMYLSSTTKVFDDQNFDRNIMSYYLVGQTYEDYIKSRNAKLELLKKRIARIQNTQILYLGDLERCHGITLKMLRCKNSKNCFKVNSKYTFLFFSPVLIVSFNCKKVAPT